MKFEVPTSRFKQWVYSGVPVGHIRGIEVSIHLVLFLVMIYWLLVAFASPSLSFLDVIAFSAALLGSVTLHELGHCYGAHLVGGKSKRILLWPLGGMATISGSQRSPRDELVVVALGPAVSLLLAIASSAVVWFFPQRLISNSLWGGVFGFWLAMRAVNWTLFIFNMIVPLFPMDCARLVRALLSMKYDPQKVTYNLCLVGFFVAGAMTCLYCIGLFNPSATLERYNIFFLLIAAFGIQSCVLQLREIQYSEVYSEPYRWDRSPKLQLSGLWAKLFAPRKIESVKPSPPEPKADSPLVNSDLKLRNLQLELDKAVAGEDFVLAARIRDKIQNLTAESAQR